MRRRDFIKVIAGSAVAAGPLAARAQQPAMPVVGYLGLTSANADAYLLAPFRKALSEAGFDEGRSVTIESRFAERDVRRFSQRSLVIKPAAELRVPAIYEWREFAEAGGLMSYGTSLTEAYRQAADFVARVLKGANRAELPVLQASKFEFVINLKTAKALNLPLAPAVFARADEVIE
jgi:ABC transporter substrate binding protein